MSYKTIDEKIIPSITDGAELAVVYIKILKKETDSAASAFSSSFSSPVASSENKYAVMHYVPETSTKKEFSPSVLLGEVKDEQINANIDVLTEGMKEGSATKVRDAIIASNGIIKSDQLVHDYEWKPHEIDGLISAANSMYDDFKKMKEGNVGSASKDKLSHYAFRKHLLIQGEKGGGKTYMVDKLIKENKYAVEFIGGHEAIEAIDFLGYYIKTETGSLVWKDGGLTSAFRRAKNGEKVVLFIDEMLRVPKRELNILVAALTPDSDGNFNLRTSRAVDVTVGDDGYGIANEEVISIQSSSLWAIGTTNAGAGYSVDTIDEALADRFRTIIKTVDEKEIKAIVGRYVKDKGYDNSVVTKLLTFYKQYHDMKKSGELTKVLNVRHLVEVVTLSDTEDQIIEMLTDLIPTITTSDVHGMPNESQCAVIEALLEKSGL